MELERDDHFFKGLGYTPITNITNHIMEEVAQEMRKCLRTSHTCSTKHPCVVLMQKTEEAHSSSCLVFSDMQDRLEMFASEEDLENASLYEPSSYVGVVFMDSSATSYRLRFPYNQLPLPSDYTESIGNVLKQCLFYIY